MNEQQQQQQPGSETQPARTEQGTLIDQTQPQQQEQTSTEKKPGEQQGSTLLTQDEKKPAEGDKKPAEGDKKPATGAPEKYEDFKAPEGFEIDKETLDKATPLFKEFGLSQENAQKLVDFYGEISKDAAEAPYKAWGELNKQWQDQVKADPMLGDGQGLKTEVRETIGKAIGLLPPDVQAEFKATMDLTGAGNHPAFVKAFYLLAQQVTEGKHVQGNKPSEHGQNPGGKKEAPTVASAMWPKLNP